MELRIRHSLDEPVTKWVANVKSTPLEKHRRLAKVQPKRSDMSEAIKTDVLIIGAGPCGLFAVSNSACST